MSVRVEKIKERHRKLRKFLLVLALAAGLMGFVQFGCSLENLALEESVYYEEDTLRSLICGDGWGSRNTLYLYCKLRLGEQPLIPFIDSVEVDFVDLHTLRVGVYEKEVIGCIPYMGEYVCFDKDGIMVGSVTERQETVPEVTGIAYQKIVFNEKVDTPQQDLFGIILNVTQLIHKYEVPATRVHFNHSKEITLYVGDIRVLLGKRDQYDEPISDLPKILEEAEGWKGNLNMKEYSSKSQRVVFIGDE